MFRGTHFSCSLAITTTLGVLAVIAALLVISQPSVVVAETVALSGPPERPSAFKNQDEVKDYLRALNDYFSIVGRPR